MSDRESDADTSPSESDDADDSRSESGAGDDSPSESDASTAPADESADPRGGTAAGTSGTPKPARSGDSGEGGTDADRRSVAQKAGIDEGTLGTPHELDARVRVQWIANSALGSAVLGAILAVVGFAIGDGFAWLPNSVTLAIYLGVGGFALSFLFGVVRAVLLYRSWAYTVREDSLFLTRGVFTRVQTVAPYVRIQHIDTQRDPFDRLLGLSTLVVYTAGSRGADVTVPGLTTDRASDLQTRLKRLAIESEEEDAV